MASCLLYSYCANENCSWIVLLAEKTLALFHEPREFIRKLSEITSVIHSVRLLTRVQGCVQYNSNLLIVFGVYSRAMRRLCLDVTSQKLNDFFPHIIFSNFIPELKMHPGILLVWIAINKINDNVSADTDESGFFKISLQGGGGLGDH